MGLKHLGLVEQQDIRQLHPEISIFKQQGHWHD